MKKHYLSLLLLTRSPLVHGANHGFFEEFFKEMQESSQRMSKAFERAVQESRTSEQAPLLEIKPGENNTIVITLSNVSLKGEKPDANLQLNEEKKQLAMEVVLNEGKLLLNYNRSYLTTQLQLESGDTHYRSYQSMNQSHYLQNKLDLSKVPSIKYEKESKKLIITLSTEPHVEKKKGTSIPIEIK